MRFILFLALVLFAVDLRAQDASQCAAVERYFYGLPVCGPYDRVLAMIDSSASFFADSVTAPGTVHFHLPPGLPHRPFSDSLPVLLICYQRAYMEEKTKKVRDTATVVTSGCLFGPGPAAKRAGDSVYRVITKGLANVFARKSDRRNPHVYEMTAYFLNLFDAAPCLEVYNGYDQGRGVYYVNVLYFRRRSYATSFRRTDIKYSE